MAATSLTSTDSFQLRAQRSELHRVVILGAVLVTVLALTTVRRLLNGAVMRVGVEFWPVVFILLAGIAYQAIAYWHVRRAVVRGLLLPWWRWWVSAAADLAVPLSLMLVLQLNSPRGAMAALSAPVLLLMPMVLMLSVLRLRPRFSLWTGVIGGVGHWVLAARALAMDGSDPDRYPVMLSYGMLLMLTGVAAALVARQAKRYVMDTVIEATESEKARARLAGVERDLSVARDIQLGLLPAGKPDFPGFDIAGMNRSADQTGGDYYDWQKLPDGRLVVVMADVTGHGIGPALVMAVCRAYARASAPIVADPVELMERLNGLICGDVQAGRFITLAIAGLDPAGGVTLLSAGHGPTLLYRAATGKVDEFGGDGLPLGIQAEEKYGPVRAITMEYGDVLVLMTDGFFECAGGPGRGQFGIPRLSEEVRGAAGVEGADAAAILARVDGAVREFAAGTPQGDDMTAVVIKRV